MPIPDYRRFASWPASLEERPAAAPELKGMLRVLGLVACLLVVWAAIVVL